MHPTRKCAFIKCMILCIAHFATISNQQTPGNENGFSRPRRATEKKDYIHLQCASRSLVCDEHYNRMVPPNTNHHQVEMEEKDGIKCFDTEHKGEKTKACPIKISVKMDILQIMNIDEDIGRVQLLMIFRQRWTDRRLELPAEFSDNCPEITEVNNGSASFDPAVSKRKVWLPDLYINGIENVYYPEVLQRAESFHVNRDALIMYNMFGIFSLSCPMDFQLFPMDVQYCPMYVESWRSSNGIQQLAWMKKNPIGIIKDYSLDQFSFSVRALAVKTQVYTTGNFSRLGVVLIFSRKIQFYILQIYFPTVLFVIISWISITIPHEYAQGRIILTITTLLTLAALYSLVSMHSPSTSYLKAIDIWMFVCLVFVFAAVVDCLVDIRILFVLSQSYKKQKLGFFTPVSVALVENKGVFNAFFGSGGKAGAAGGGGSKDSPTPSDFFDVASAPEPEPADGSNTLNVPGQAKQRNVSFAPEPQPGPAASQQPTTEYRWSRAADLFERWSVAIYPVAFVLFNLVYWSYFMTAAHPPHELDEDMANGFTPEPESQAVPDDLY